MKRPRSMEWGKLPLPSFYFYTGGAEDLTATNEGAKPLAHMSIIREWAALHLLTACAGFEEKPRSCASIFTMFSHVKRQTARGSVRLTVGPPCHVPSGRSAKHRDPNSFDYQVTFDCQTFNKKDSRRPEEILHSSL